MGLTWEKVLTVRGVWVAQSGKTLTSAQVVISRFMSSSPTSGSARTERSLLGILSLPLSLLLPCVCTPCLSPHQ